MRPFLIRRGGRLCVCTTPKKRLSSLNTKTTTTKGRQTSPKRPLFFRLVHSFAVRLQRIGMQRETTTRPIFKSKGDYLLKIGKYHAFRKMPRANRAACVWFESTPPPFKKPPPPVAAWLLCGKIVHVSISPPSANRSKFRNNPRLACNNGGFSCNNGRYFRNNRGFSETTKEQPKRPARIITRNGLFRGEIASCTTYLRFICNLRFAPPPFLLNFAPFVHFFYSIGFCGRLLCGAAARLFRSIQEKHNAPPRVESLNTWIYHTICPLICRVTTFGRPGGQLHDERKKTRQTRKTPRPKNAPAVVSGSPRFVERSRGGAFGSR